MACSVLLLALPALTAPVPPASDEPAVPVQNVGEHATPVTHLVFAPKGDALLLAGEDGTVHALDPDEDACLWEQTGGRAVPLCGIDVDGGGDVYLTVRGLSGVDVLDGRDGERRFAAGAPNPLARAACLASDPKGRWAWIGTEEGGLFRLTPQNVNAWSRRKMENGGVTSLAADPRGKSVAVGGRDGTIRAMKASNASRDGVTEAHAGAVLALAYGPRGTLVSGGAGGTIRTWSGRGGRARIELEAHEGEVLSVGVDPRRRWIASGGRDERLRLWALRDGAQIASFDADGPVQDLAFSPDGARLASVEGGAVRVRDLSGL